MNYTAIVPSLDPDEKLLQVVTGLLDVGFKDIILVNDGSHADHLSPFLEAAKHPEVTVLTHEVNKGKGRAMKTAFAWCLENRPDIDGVVTVDGDNQHLPKDVIACCEVSYKVPGKLWLGVRDFSLEHVPLRSRLGNVITRSFMKLACGVSVTDTQTGLRAFSRDLLSVMLKVDGERYEYETQQLLSMRSENVAIGEIIISTVYINDNESSHFDTFRDSRRIYKIIFRHIGRNLRSFLKFSLSSIICFLLDYGLFTLLNTVLLSGLPTGSREIFATYGARIVSAIVNFLLNRNLIFCSKEKLSCSAVKYCALAVVQAGLSALLVCGIQKLTNAAALMETVIKIPVDLVLFVISYKIQKNWVFSKKK